MNFFQKTTRPKNREALLELCAAIEGYSFAQLAKELSLVIPDNPHQRKGWLGLALEVALGADAMNKAMPDFQELGIELKTLPIGKKGRPRESTFITSIPLLTIHQETWLTSTCYSKLKEVLWVLIEGDREIPYGQRRIGSATLWSPNVNQLEILEKDWTFLTTQISTGFLDNLDARVGEYLQIRPKAADGKSLCFAFDSEGNKVQTLPRGFYLRSSFTATMF